MKLNTLKPAEGSKGRVKRVGRGPGSGRGKTASRGNNGAKSRSVLPQGRFRRRSDAYTETPSQVRFQ